MNVYKKPEFSLISVGVSIFLFWFASNLPLGIFTLGGPPPILSYLAFIGFGAACVLWQAFEKRPILGQDDWQIVRPFLYWIYLWVIWTLISFLGSSQSPVATQVMVNQLEMALILLFLIVLLFNHVTPRMIGWTLAATAVFGAIVTIQDFMVPTYSTVPGRAAGFYLNPNIAAFILIQLMIMVLPYLWVSLRWPFVALVSIAVFLTFARAGWLVLFISLSYLFWAGHLGFQRIRAALGLVAIGLIGLLGYGILSGALVEVLLDTSLAQYLDKNTLARLGFVKFASDFAADERSDALSLALGVFASGGKPFLGLGLGYTREWEFPASTHNMYALYLVEGGIVGLILYLSLIGMLLWRSEGRMRLVAINIAIYSFFTHNLLDSPGRLIVIALIMTQLLQSTKTYSSSHFPEQRNV
ncbi:O-antigen ligase [Tropicibacter sp. Alg240-R139]|uniref:O-antigen ligase family protein n=1 Tax=Tropicibacter sp. Alg240-R139 TaxID=2305991 RepID=UPI0013DFDC5B|nr:O-antigen ligase family protein [Tropicibacter sp. Alg240-R139]